MRNNVVSLTLQDLYARERDCKRRILARHAAFELWQQQLRALEEAEWNKLQAEIAPFAARLTSVEKEIERLETGVTDVNAIAS